MKNFYKRVIAYFIDMVIISIITMSITYMPIFSGDLVKYRKVFKEYNKEYTEYLGFSRDINGYYKDNKLSDKEYHKLIDKYSKYSDNINKYYINNKLTKSNYKKLTSDINDKWSKLYKKYNYKLNKYSIVSNVSSFVVILIYFLGCNIFMNGMTVGKKLMKLRIVSFDDSNKVSKLNYVIRTIILYNPIYYIAIVLGLFIFNVNSYYNWSYVWSDIKNYLEIFIVFMIIVRKDSRGLHEILSNTKVVDVDNVVDVNNKDDVTVIKKDNSSKIKKGKNNRKVVIDEE